MTCEFIPQPTQPLCGNGPHCTTCPGNGGTSRVPGAHAGRSRLTPDEVMVSEYQQASAEQLAEELADERNAVAILLAVVGVAAVSGFVCGYLFTRWGVL